MLIAPQEVLDLLRRYGVQVQSVLHIGAHECEEKSFYNNVLNVEDKDIIWVDANPAKVMLMHYRGNMNVFCTVLDETEREVTFHFTDNSQASSILELNHEKGFYENIHIVGHQTRRSETVGQFFRRIQRDPTPFNFWNLDIQGVELMVLRGAVELLSNCDAIYTEVNRDYVYKGCGLVTEIDELLAAHGFERVHTLWTDVQWGDALYVKTNSSKQGTATPTENHHQQQASDPTTK